MMLLFLVDANLLISSTLAIGALNLAVPLLAKNQLCIFLSLVISLLFLVNILVLGWLFFAGLLPFHLTIFTLSHYNFALHLEPLGLIFLALLGTLWVVALLYSLPYLQANNSKNSGQFIFFLNLCILIGALLALAANLLTMFVFYEFLSLATVPLLSHAASPAQNIRLYLKTLLLTSLCFLLPAILLVYHWAGAGNFVLGGYVADCFARPWLIILLLLFVFGIGKAALAPFHNWLLAAMIAPYPASALLHAVVVVKAGLFCTFKVLLYVFGLEYLGQIFSNYNWLIYLPICTILYSSLKACFAQNIKMILAYSTINHLSLALLSAFLLTPKGMLGAVLHLLSHSLGKIGLFYGLGSLYSLSKATNLADLTSASKAAPFISAIILLSMLALIGLPPFGGFISKFYLLAAAVEQEQLLVISVIIASSMLAAWYFGKIALKLYQPTATILVRPEREHTELKGGESEHKKSENNLPPSMIFSCLLVLVFNLLFVFILPIISHLARYL